MNFVNINLTCRAKKKLTFPSEKLPKNLSFPSTFNLSDSKVGHSSGDVVSFFFYNSRYSLLPYT